MAMDGLNEEEAERASMVLPHTSLRDAFLTPARKKRPRHYHRGTWYCKPCRSHPPTCGKAQACRECGFSLRWICPYCDRDYARRTRARHTRYCRARYERARRLRRSHASHSSNECGSELCEDEVSIGGGSNSSSEDTEVTPQLTPASDPNDSAAYRGLSWVSFSPASSQV